MAGLMPTAFRVTNARELPDTIEPMSRRVAEEVEGDARSRTPKVTGRLASGWRVEHLHGTVYLVTNDVPYAIYVEFGTRYERPAAMLGEAMALARSRYE